MVHIAGILVNAGRTFTVSFKYETVSVEDVVAIRPLEKDAEVKAFVREIV